MEQALSFFAKQASERAIVFIIIEPEKRVEVLTR